MMPLFRAIEKNAKNMGRQNLNVCNILNNTLMIIIININSMCYGAEVPDIFLGSSHTFLI